MNLWRMRSSTHLWSWQTDIEPRFVCITWKEMLCSHCKKRLSLCSSALGWVSELAMSLSNNINPSHSSTCSMQYAIPVNRYLDSHKHTTSITESLVQWLNCRGKKPLKVVNKSLPTTYMIPHGNSDHFLLPFTYGVQITLMTWTWHICSMLVSLLLSPT